MRAKTDWLSIRQYADRYNVHRHTVVKWMELGLVTYWKVEKVIRIKAQPPLEVRPSHQQPTS